MGKRIILFLDNPSIPTGYASTCRLTIKELKKRGYDCYAISFNGGAQSAAMVEWYGIKILPNLALERNPDCGYGDAELVRQIARDYQPDIFFFHNDAYRYSYIKDLPPEILDRSVFWLPFEGTTADVGGLDIFRRVTATRFVTQHAMNMHKDAMPGRDIGVITHAVDFEAFGPTVDKQGAKRAKNLAMENKFVVCRVDRHQPRKLWHLTIKAFAKFAKGKNDVFLLAKCDPQDCVMYNQKTKEGLDLTVLAQDEGLRNAKVGDKVDPEGNLFFDNYFFSNDYMAKAFYHPADVFLSTTSGEGFGLPIVEAMACGVPIICPNVPVLPEVVKEGGTLCRIEGQQWHNPLQLNHSLVSIDDVVSKLEEHYADWKTGGRMLADIGKKARKIAEDNYSPKGVYDQWDRTFQSITAKSTKASIVTVLYNMVDDQITSPEYGVQNFLDSMDKYVTSDYEWIIVDNGSPAREKTRAWMDEAAKKNPNIKLVFQDVNLGFAGACNLGIANAVGGCVFLCNPDSQALNPQTHGMTKDFIGTMMDKAASDQNIGVIGMHLNKRDDVLKGAVFPYFCCVLLTKRCLDAVRISDNKWFDEAFWPAYYEDLDFCLRAASKGFKISECNCAFYHVSGGTNRHAIEGGKSGPHVKPFEQALEVLSKNRPEMADWTRKSKELSANGMQSMIQGNIDYLNQKWGMEARKAIKLVFHTRIGDNVGFSMLVEGLAPALEDLGFSVYINDAAGKSNVDNPVIDKMIDRYNEANVKGELADAIHVVVWLMETFQQVEADFKVGVSFCESTKVRESYLSLCNSMDRILTFSNFCRGVQRDSGYKVPIDVLPFGIHPSFLRYQKRDRKDKFTFLSVGVSQGRKNMDDLVRAFCEAFPKDQEYPPEHKEGFPYKNKDVVLVLKSNNFGDLNWVKQQGWLSKANIVTIFTGQDDKAERKDYSINEMLDLYCSADAYIHPSHGEGIGLPIMEAAATGLAPIFTNWSTPKEYLDESCSYPIPLPAYQEMAFSKAYEFAPGDNGVWANPSVPHMKQIMYDVIMNRDESERRGRTAADKMCQEHNWEKCAKAMMPMLFDWDAQRKMKKPYIDFDPYTFEKPRLEMVMPNDRIVVDVVTRDRHGYLCSLLTSLLMQTFKNWDLIIECDDKDESMPKDHQIQSLMNRCWHEGHGWQILRSQRQGPHMAHDRTLQVALKDPKQWKLICRIDDDIYVKPDYLEKLFKVFVDDETCQVGAVAGVYLDPKRPDADQTAPPGWEKDIEYAGLIEPNRPWPYTCLYPPGTGLREMQHLYSSFLFRTKCAAAIGGYCKQFSPIGHREESDFSYRFHLAGWKLFVNPEAVGYHYYAPSGGIRSDGINNKNALAENDHKIYMRRMEFWSKRLALRKSSNKPPLIDESDHRFDDKKAKTVAVVSRTSSLPLDEVIGHFSKYASKILLVGQGFEIKSPGVEMFDEVSAANSAAMLDDNFDYVISAEDAMRFVENPLQFLGGEYSEYVFDVHSTYSPGSRRVGAEGTVEFVWQPSKDKVIGPEAREECLILYKRAMGSEKAHKCRSMVLDDRNVVPSSGCSLLGNKLMTLRDAKSSKWTKYITSVYRSSQDPKYIPASPLEKVVNPGTASLVSIIIPTAGRKHLLRRCIDSIFSYTRSPFEIVIVDNGSDDGTAAMIRDVQEGRTNIKSFRNPSNLGYQKALNQAVEMSSGDYLLFFNDDAWVEGYQPDGTDWVKAYVDELKDETIGLVGPHPGQSPTLGIDMLFFWCVMMRRLTYDTVGPFDEKFFNYGGDDDYCKRVLDVGMKIKHKETRLRHLMNCVPDDVKQPALAESRKILREKYGIEGEDEEKKARSSPGKKKVVMYSMGQGLGHVTRSLSVGRFMSSEVDVEIITDSQLAREIMMGGFEDVNSEGCRIKFVADVGERNDNVLDMMDAASPDMVIVDCFPAGLRDELRDWLPTYKGRKVLVMQSLSREYLDPRRDAFSLYENAICCEKGADPSMGPCMETCPWLIRSRTELLTREKALVKMECDGKKKVIVVPCCGKKAEVESMTEFANRLSNEPSLEADVRLFGPGGSRYWPILDLMEAIDLVIGQPGYSLLHEVRATNTPFLAITRERSFESQAGRVSPSEVITEIDVEKIVKKVQSLPATRTIGFYDNGSIEAASLLKGMLRQGKT